MGVSIEPKATRKFNSGSRGWAVCRRKHRQAAGKSAGTVPGAILCLQLLGGLRLAPVAALAIGEENRERERPCGQLFTVTPGLVFAPGTPQCG